MVVTHPAVERLDDLRTLGLQAGMREIRQALGVGFQVL
jgi:hypothetical protein